MKATLVYLHLALSAIGIDGALANASTPLAEIQLVKTNRFTQIWNDQGSGGDIDVKFWDAVKQGNLRPLGSTCNPSYAGIDNGTGYAYLIGTTTAASSSANPAVKSPTGYNKIWTDKGSGARANGSLWRPNCPLGYVSLGDVAQNGWGEPSTSRVWCLRVDLAEEAGYGSSPIWWDKGSGSDKDVSVWEIHRSIESRSHVFGAFRANEGYGRPDISHAIVPQALESI
ncbi:duf946 domain-containing protein [Trichoderma arundinaceum]|uniref:Duf946 domain-containing protein n=1 Tax=Trichoderma arundinaceum TaxID=490622 RepID=A0A395NB10_TRIAR|nr:duf946 domain-containing protein [Trichoderma arundinaceum]